MKTDYNNINKFEVAVVSMIAVGFVILGVTLFSTLSPRQQAAVSSAFDIFDMREHVTASIEGVKFVYGIPAEFYNEFYIAFNEVASWPADDLDLAASVAVELKRNVTVVFDNLTAQVAAGYASQNQLQSQDKEVALLPHDGKIMGVMIEASDKLNGIRALQTEAPKSLNFHYEYVAPKIELPNFVINYLNP